MTKHRNEQREQSRTQGGPKGPNTSKLDTFEGTGGGFLKVESMEIAKRIVFHVQETLLARSRFPGSVFHKPETLFAVVSKLKKKIMLLSQGEVVLEAKSE